MSLRDVLVFLDPGVASNERLRLAADIARQHQAFLSAVFLADDDIAESPSGLNVPRIALMAGAPLPLSSETSRVAPSASTAEEIFRERLRCCKGAGDWHALGRRRTNDLIQLARSADLVIMGQINPNTRDAHKYRPEEIVVTCGRPVLMVPYIGTFNQIGRRVMVAWDGSRAAARALNDALPVIDSTGAVTVLTVRNRPTKATDHGNSSADRIARHLNRHGITVRAEEVQRGSNTVYDVLLSRAADFSIDMIIAGANHHSPLWEALIDGVSAGLFRHMTVPVLMSH